ncbi:MAG: hypothetical protein NVS4B8_03230 [Herpetosiphon sp.]
MLMALHDATVAYHKVQGKLAAQADELLEATEQRDTAEATITELRQRVAELEREQESTARERERADHLAETLKEVQKALFSGNVYELILRACLTLTHGTRGLYVSSLGPEAKLQIRAAANIDGTPARRVTPFIETLCRRVLAERKHIVLNGNDPDIRDELPGGGPRFNNIVVVPAVMLRHFDGIIILADKIAGDFSEKDVEAVLTVGDEASIALENAHLHEQLQSAYLDTITVLADAVEAKDSYTHGHCEQVAHFARMTARELGLDHHVQSFVFYAALLHDIGKIGVSDGVLNKPGALLPEEMSLVRSHVRVGYDLIRNVTPLERIAEIVLHHHEWYDGSGYPEGLKSDNIPLAARIVGVSDSYCAMTTKRSYKDAFTPERARAELVRCAGVQFDPQVVDAFLVVLDQDPEPTYPWQSIAYGLLPLGSKPEEY